jgi:hypothetical protein
MASENNAKRLIAAWPKPKAMPFFKFIQEKGIAGAGFSKTKFQADVRMVIVKSLPSSSLRGTRVISRWAQLPVEAKAACVRRLKNHHTWLSRFENDWAAEFLIRDCVNRSQSEGMRRHRHRETSNAELLANGGKFYIQN